MDFDDFESNVLIEAELAETVEDERVPEERTFENAAEALESMDNEWYIETCRRARWMSLIGDYCGNEPFVLHGDSLVERVLGDPLLALGRPGDPSFQIMHALYAVESFLLDMTKRGAIFDIVFFHDTRDSSLKTGSALFTAASRSLARRLIFQHLGQLPVSLYSFSGLHDKEWTKYRKTRRPMFIMANDGGAKPSPDGLAPEQLLGRRVFLYKSFTSGLPIVLLNSVEFRDMNILAFVQDSYRDPSAKSRFPTQFWETVDKADDALRAAESSSGTHAPTILKKIPTAQTLPNIIEIFCNAYQRASTRHTLTDLLFPAFIAHLLALESVSLAQRSQTLPMISLELTNIIMDEFLPGVFSVLEGVSMRTGWCPDVDGRIFVRLLQYCAGNTQSSLSNVIGQDPRISPSLLTKPIDFTPLHDHFTASKTPHLAGPEEAYSLLLPFKSEIFQDELKDVMVKEYPDVDDFSTRDAPVFGSDAVFNDTHHWHNEKRALLPKHLGGEDPKPQDAWQRMKALRRHQQFMASLQRQAVTLSGALGVPLRQETIVAVGPEKKQSQKRDNPKKAQAAHAKLAKKGAKLTSIEKQRELIAQEKQAKIDKQYEQWWIDRLADIGKCATIQDKLSLMENFMRSKKAEESWLALEMRTYQLHLRLHQWVDDPRREDAAVRDSYTVLIVRSIMDVYSRKRLSNAVLKCLEAALAALGFANMIAALSSNASREDGNRNLSFKFIKLSSKSKGTPVYEFMEVAEHPIEWQLRLFGEYMDRSMDSQPDSRVPFEPDQWQRQVLDAVDLNESVLVVAPTSAGKTFISYYAMEKVLRESDDGILVYVAPTKALVNQVAAEIHARFGKDLSRRGLTCWAIHTRDYRINDPQKCQVLVTVPEMLAIMLLSPPLARTWTPRLKRIILDEIHSIGQQEGGSVWEQLLLLAPCPIIGLSATIGHPEQFDTWLKTVQEKHGFKHQFIYHPHRYSHLRKHLYLMPAESRPFKGLDKHMSSDSIRFLHPCTMLDQGATSIPSDFSMEAGDTLTFYRALRQHRNAIIALGVDVDVLDPKSFFKDCVILRQKDVLRYEASLKDVLVQLMGAGTADAAHGSVLDAVVSSLQDPLIKATPIQKLNASPSRLQFALGLWQLILDLHATGDLPALFFSFDRHLCEVMAFNILKRMELAEQSWKKTDPSWLRKMQQWELWKERMLRQQRTAEKAKKQRRAADDDAFDAPEDASWEASFDPSQPSPQFSFAGTQKYSLAELEKDIEALRWTPTPQWAFRALQRGIGVHHAGMNRAYRSLLESLFRLGFVKIVFATGTLALGINAPTKTSVFCGDSPFLTSLNYRQCAGRAGRRGFDLLGKVVFFGLPFERMQRLMSSKLPQLTGNFPMTSTLCLRLFNLLHGSNNAEVAVKAVQSLLRLPHISFGSHIGQEQLVHHFRFSIEYLRRAGLLDVNGRPLQTFGIAAHLFYTDPSNLALVALLRSGLVHTICNQASILKAKDDLLVLLCNLFARKYLPQSYTTPDSLKARRTSYPSHVVLPPLSAKARKVLTAHDQETLKVFSSYASMYAREKLADQEDNVLPFSLRKVADSAGDAVTQSQFVRDLASSANLVVTRSLFVANSGHGDQFGSVEELTTTARDGLHLNEHAIPSFAHITVKPSADDTSRPRLNAYIYDFYTHGQVTALVKANGIRRGDVWYALQDFALTLMAIRAAIHRIILESTGASAGDDLDDLADAEDNLDARANKVPVSTADAGPAEEGDDNAASTPGSATPNTGGTSASNGDIPAGVRAKDLRLYKVIHELEQEFSEKFKAMWA